MVHTLLLINFPKYINTVCALYVIFKTIGR